MLVKDEADVIEYTIRHLLANVDRIYVLDNLSTDGTLTILDRLENSYGRDRIFVGIDRDVAYEQDRKTTELATIAREDGFDWVIPCDADEWWHSNDLRPISAFLAGLAPDVAMVRADLYNHLPTILDGCSDCGGHGWIAEPGPEPDLPNQIECATCEGTGEERNPFRRIGWRQRQHGALGKVAARLLPGLEIHMGNHSAYLPGSGMTVAGLSVRHFSWRSEEQYLSKIRNGAIAYAATDFPESTGAHWRMFGLPDSPDFDERVRDHYRTWFGGLDPSSDDSLIYDPAP